MTSHLPPESARLIQALQSPGCYGESVARVELMETHISWILLTGEYAYKIKKPVDFGFVNFMTLERRKFFCEEELRLNRRLAPRLYLDVVPITGTADDPRLAGDGEAIEYAVKMRQFPQEALLNHAIETGRLLPEHIDKLAEEIADFHARAAVAKTEGETSPFGTPQKILAAAWGNFQVLLEQELDQGNPRGESRLPTELNSSEVQLHGLLTWTRTQAKRLSERFIQRKNEGAVRECHGDMHLGNMLLEDGEIVIFDGIEFNADFRWIDVLSEVAFCLMDLTDWNRPDYAHRLLNHYLEHTGDYGGLEVLPFYLTYRALVRAKVAHLGWRQHEEQEADSREQLAGRRQEYIRLAHQFTEPRMPQLMITHGLSGSGKSFGTQKLIETLGAVRVRSDVERKRLAGLMRSEKSHSVLEGNLYSSASTEATYNHLANCAEEIIKAGFPAVVDATFLKAAHRQLIRQVAERLAVPFRILDFQASDEQLRERITNRLNQGADPSEASLEVLNYQIQNREPLQPDEQTYVIPINTEDPNVIDHMLQAVK
jgi:uncharacterized protein